MAIKDFLNVIDNRLKDVFDRKASDPLKTRRPLLRGIDRTLQQFKGGSSGAGTGWYKVKNEVVALTVKVGGDTFDINGAPTNHMPVDGFEEFLTNMRAAVEAGEFDAKLASHGKGDAEVHIPKQRKPATISSEAAKARGIKAAASRKANKEKAAAVPLANSSADGAADVIAADVVTADVVAADTGPKRRISRAKSKEAVG